MRELAKHIAKVLISQPITLQDLTLVKELVQIKQIKYVFTSGILNKENKKRLVYTIADSLNLSVVAKHLLFYLLKNQLTSIIDTIIECYVKLSDKKNNVLRVIVYSPIRLTEKQLLRLKEKLQDMGNFKEIILEVEIVPQLLGGLRLQIGDKVIDGTLCGYLERLHQRLSGVAYEYS